jgi:hypothetical protein
LEAKFHGLSDPVIGAAHSADLIQAAWALGDAPSVQALVALARS